MARRLKIYVGQARGLPEVDGRGKISAFFQITVGSRAQRTQVVQNNKDPYFNEPLYFEVTPNVKQFQIELFDARDKRLHSTVLYDIEETHPTKDYPLGVDKFKNIPCGIVVLDIKFETTQEEIDGLHAEIGRLRAQQTEERQLQEQQTKQVLDLQAQLQAQTLPQEQQARQVLDLQAQQQQRLQAQEAQIQRLLARVDAIYPVGGIHMSAVDRNPSEFLGGQWVRWGSGRVPVGVSADDTDFQTPEHTGGSKVVDLNHRHEAEDLRACIGSGHEDASSLVFDATSANNPITGATAEGLYKVRGTDNGGYNTPQMGHFPFSHYTRVQGYTNHKLNTAQSVMNPYITCFMWKRIA